jgi:hypothetical protein
VKASPRHAANRSLSSSTQKIGVPGFKTELTVDGGRGFTSPFLHRRKADPTARPCPLPGTLTFFGTVVMVAGLLKSILFK